MPKYQYDIIFKLEDYLPISIMSMDKNMSLDLYLFLTCHSSTGIFFTYFGNQLPGTFELRLVKNSNSAWKYCIYLNKCPGLNTLAGMPNQELMVK